MDPEQQVDQRLEALLQLELISLQNLKLQVLQIAEHRQQVLVKQLQYIFQDHHHLVLLVLLHHAKAEVLVHL